MNNPIPNGYMENAQGHLVPVDAVNDLDILRNDLVIAAVSMAQELRQDLTHYKESVTDDITAFIELAAEKYDTTFGGKKGNLTLTSYDGRYRLQIAISDTITFDERLQIAKQLIDECIHKWTENSSVNIKALIEHAFQTDKQGNINTGRVLGLMKLKINEQTWTKAMEALKDSISVASSKSYMRLYQRVGNEDKYEQISLDVSSL